ncbi:BglG family transcription antiterminator [Anoxybacterium hadale]|uniref:BglG family transcription antiterminator n=1 Tax=Anoxybacterium hadale TaxID=3408580 RepID=UPI003B00851A
METLTLHARQRKLLYILNYKHGIMTGKELSSQLGVSERTIRSDIAEINRLMKAYGTQINSLHGKGYCLEVADRLAFHHLFLEKENLQTKEDRIRYLILKLISENDWYDLGLLEDEMFISRTTLENDMKAVKNRFSDRKPHLALLRRGTHVKLEEDEIKKRNILIRLYCENWDYDSRDGIILKEDLINHEMLNQIRLVLKDVLRKYRIDLDDFGLIYMILAVAVSYSRVQSGFGIGSKMGGRTLGLSASGRPETEALLLASSGISAEAVRQIFEQLRQTWDLEPDVSEQRWITGILKQLCTQNFTDTKRGAVLEHTSATCEILVEQLLQELNAEYLLDFRLDDSFCKDMLLHVQALMNGMISVQLQSKHLTDKLRLQHPYLSCVAQYLCERLEQICELELGLEEENYLLPLLISGQKHDLEQKRGRGIQVAVASHMNSSLTGYFIGRLREVYGGRIDIKGPFPIYDRQRIDRAEPALVLTTAQMDAFRRFDVPVITVSPLIEAEDQKRINEHLKRIEDDLLYQKLSARQEAGLRELEWQRIDEKPDISELLSVLTNHIKASRGLELNPVADSYRHVVLKNNVVFFYIELGRDADLSMDGAICKNTFSWGHNRNLRGAILAVLPDKKQLGRVLVLAEELSDFEAISLR